MPDNWNPKFGFYFPINSNIKKSILNLTSDDYDDPSSPIPLIELWSENNTHIDNLDSLASFGSRAIKKSKPRIGDIIVTCDYSKRVYCRHYIFASHSTFCVHAQNHAPIKSKKYKRRKYICLLYTSPSPRDRG